MNLCKYLGFFHDGFVHDIQTRDDYIQFTLVELLSTSGSLVGNLCLEGIISLEFEPGAEQSFERLSSSNSIMSLELVDNTVKLAMVWEDCKDSETDLPMICTIRARRVYWENRPDFIDLVSPTIEVYTESFHGGNLINIRTLSDKQGLIFDVDCQLPPDHKLPKWVVGTASDKLTGELQARWIVKVTLNGEIKSTCYDYMRTPIARIDTLKIINHCITLDLTWLSEEKRDLSTNAKDRLEVVAGAISWRPTYG